MKKSITVLLLAFGFSAHAYHIDEHRAITDQAFQELGKCFPQAQALLDLDWITNGNVDEDLDLVTKWLFYSHYYNPNKQLDMRRADSAERVTGLASTLRKQPNDAVDLTEMTSVGHMIHHFQDATVPSHVVPVDHSLWDGFEKYKVSSFSSGLSCDQIAALSTADALTILKETAQSTLNNIESMRFEFVSVAKGITNRIEAAGSAFWEESTDNEFGQYGYLGNNFGQTSFSIGQVSFQVADESYQTFKKQQLELATRATIRGLMWELGDRLTNTRSVCLPSKTVYL